MSINNYISSMNQYYWQIKNGLVIMNAALFKADVFLTQGKICLQGTSKCLIVSVDRSIVEFWVLWSIVKSNNWSSLWPHPHEARVFYSQSFFISPSFLVILQSQFSRFVHSGSRGKRWISFDSDMQIILMECSTFCFFVYKMCVQLFGG